MMLNDLPTGSIARQYIYIYIYIYICVCVHYLHYLHYFHYFTFNHFSLHNSLFLAILVYSGPTAALKS